MQIVIARAEETKLVPTGKFVMRDHNWFPEFRVELEGRAAMWLQKGTSADLEKAKEFAAIEGWKVFTFDAKERDPIGRAKSAVVTQ